MRFCYFNRGKYQRSRDASQRQECLKQGIVSPAIYNRRQCCFLHESLLDDVLLAFEEVQLTDSNPVGRSQERLVHQWIGNSDLSLGFEGCMVVGS